MSALFIFQAPIGSLIAWTDETPRPPERHRRKLSQWQSNNSRGRLIRKQGERAAGSINLPASFTLHEADYESGGVIAVRIHRTFSADSRLRFRVFERPAIGAVQVLDRPGDDAELVHLAANWEAAEAWLESHSFPNAVLREITADEVAADAIEGRAVA
ncbi:hypothetical protein [Mesorhizobium sp.]|uniref:hypothetical protein n=1 Tax=Mesorhizobium sp. TaxID=1871066 RepID=UPI000FE4ED91|nr:hypothetical protein [Mesorhizobium sp.]RWI34065.1 MAG: hypothetical protein EOR14_31890 [Mesorhizobium sp.]RWI63616.1 MAG: hypothetical protein EOR17_28035 [Mesorhizobium sp.]RWJ25306.1 MAG: hypothetical protein EOR28_28305 [Mesorhizobium sp.]TIQ70054.1 MAG: hypothetical protein E5X40_24175 [Mesorhizobium sp.]